MPLTKLGTNEGQFIVDELQPGEIRIRLGGYPSLEECMIFFKPLLNKLQEEYAAIITCGSGGYSDCGEISVRPKPGTKASGGTHLFSLRNHAGTDKEPKHVQLRACMVREDVWQSLLSMKVDDWGNERNSDQYTEFAKECWAEYNKRFVEKKSKRTDLSPETQEFFDDLDYYTWRSWPNRQRNPVGYLVCENPSINGFGMDTSFTLMAKSQPSQKDADNFCRVIGETAFVTDIMRTIRMAWKPEDTTSPQFGEWETHQEFHTKMVECTAREVAEIQRRRKEDEEWEKEYQESKKKQETHSEEKQ